MKLLKAWNDYRKSVKTLKSLSDRTLRDIGISRAEIHDVAGQKPDTWLYLKNIFVKTHNIDEYLRKSNSLSDLENRQRNLHRKEFL